MYSNYLPYYVLWLQQRQRQQEEAKKKAEEEEAKQQVQQQLQEEYQEQQKTEETEAVEKVEEKQETVVEESKPESVQETTETIEEKSPSPITDTTSKQQEESNKTSSVTIVPKPTDCELLYAIGSEEFLLCDYNRKTDQQNNMLLAVMFLVCIAIAVGICAIIVRHIDKKVEQDLKNNKGGYYLG